MTKQQWKVKLTKQKASDIVSTILDKLNVQYGILIVLVKFCFSVSFNLLIAFLFETNYLQSLEMVEKLIISSSVALLLIAAGNLLNSIWGIRDHRFHFFFVKSQIILEESGLVDFNDC